MPQSTPQIIAKSLLLLFLTFSFSQSRAQDQSILDLGYKKVTLINVNGKKGLVTGKKVILPVLYDSISPLKKHYVKVYQGAKVGVYALEKAQVVPCLYDRLDLVNDSLLLSNIDRRIGLLTLSNNILLEPVHKAVVVNGYGNSIVEFFKKIKIVSSGQAIEVEGDSVVDHYYSHWLYYNGRIEKIKKNIDSIAIKQTVTMTRTEVKMPVVAYGDKVYGHFSCDTLFSGLFDSSYYYHDSILIYKNGPKYGLANIGPNILTLPEYDEIAPLNQKYFKFKKNGLWGIISRYGRIVTDTLYDCMQEVPSHQYCKVSLGGKEGLIGYNGATIVPAWYPYLQKDMSEHIFTFSHKGKYVAIVDSTGIQLLDTNYRYQEIGKFQNGFARVKKSDKYGFINKKGGLTIATQYLKVCDKVVEDRASVMLKGKWALVDSWEKMLAQPYYDSIGHFQDSVAIAVKNKKYLLLSYYGRELCGAKFEFIERYDRENYIVKSGGKLGVMHRDGNEVVFTKYDKIPSINKNHIIVKSFQKLGLLDHNGKEIAPMEYDQIILSPNDRGYVLVKNVGRSIVKF